MKALRVLNPICVVSVVAVLFASALLCYSSDYISDRTVIGDADYQEYIYHLEEYIRYLEESIDEISDNDECDYMGDVIMEGDKWLDYYFARKEFYEKVESLCDETIEY